MRRPRQRPRRIRKRSEHNNKIGQLEVTLWREACSLPPMVRRPTPAPGWTARLGSLNSIARPRTCPRGRSPLALSLARAARCAARVAHPPLLSAAPARAAPPCCGPAAAPAAACGRLRPPAAACGRLRPPAAACGRLRPPAAGAPPPPCTSSAGVRAFSAVLRSSRSARALSLLGSVRAPNCQRPADTSPGQQQRATCTVTGLYLPSLLHLLHLFHTFVPHFPILKFHLPPIHTRSTRRSSWATRSRSGLRGFRPGHRRVGRGAREPWRAPRAGQRVAGQRDGLVTRRK